MREDAAHPLVKAGVRRQVQRRLARGVAGVGADEVQGGVDVLDIGGRGVIQMDEFLMLQEVGGLEMTRAELKALFLAKDVDGSATLDMREFKELVADSKLLEHAQSIIEHGAAAKAAADEAKASSVELWRLGLPKKESGASAPTKERPPLTKRPSLVGISAAIDNMRAKLGSVSV